FLQKLAIQVLGNHDYILRSVPLVAGIVSLLLMYKAASKLLGTAGMLVSTALFAVSNPLVYYASEAKQYSGDALATLVLVLVAYKCFETQPCPRCYFCLIAGGVACMWISHPAVFIIAGLGLGLAVNQLLRPDRRRLFWLGLVFMTWLLSFGFLYCISLRHLAADAALTQFWRSYAAFMPMLPLRAAAWTLRAFVLMFHNPVGLVVPLT